MDDLLSGKLNRNTLMKEVRRRILLHNADLHHKLTDKVAVAICAFAEGYVLCFDQLVTKELNNQAEMVDFILSQIVDYAVKRAIEEK